MTFFERSSLSTHFDIGYTGPGFIAQNIKDAIDYYNAKSGIVVFAAGNSNSESAYYPGYYEGAVAVAAVKNSGVRADFSNYGDWIEIAAPGVSVYSTLTGSTYGYASGTSMAAPHVAGMLALGMAVDMTFPRDGLLACAYDTAMPIDDLNPDYEEKLGEKAVFLWGWRNLFIVTLRRHRHDRRGQVRPVRHERRGSRAPDAEAYASADPSAYDESDAEAQRFADASAHAEPDALADAQAFERADARAHARAHARAYIQADAPADAPAHAAAHAAPDAPAVARADASAHAQADGRAHGQAHG